MEMLTEKERKLVEFSKEVQENDATRTAVEARVKKEMELRRKVHDSVVELTEVVDNEELRSKLPYLDQNSWDDLIEERFLAKMCGFPTCDMDIERKSTQKYHIDLRNRKIYETCKERNKFCCVECFNMAATIRAQLTEYPLWLTGEKGDRMTKKYVIDPRVMPPRPETADSKKPTVSIEIVEDIRPVLRKLHALKVAEHGDLGEDDTMDDEERAEMQRVKKDDDDFVSSVRRFIEQRPAGSGGVPSSSDDVIRKKDDVTKETDSEKATSSASPMPSSTNQPTSLPEKQQGSVSRLSLSKAEEDKLSRLRRKFGANSSLQRSPKLISAPVIDPKRARESAAAETVVTTELIDFDGECISVPEATQEENSKTTHDAEMEPQLTEADVDTVRKLINGWWTPRSRELVLMGGRRPTSEIDGILNRYLKGDDREDTSDIMLPAVDSVDVPKKQLEILITSLKPTFLKLERRLRMSSSRTHLFAQLLSSFSLQADTVADFERSHIPLVVILIFRLICQMDEEMEESFFPGGFASKQIDEYLQYTRIDPTDFARLTKEILLKLE